jgi:hypothetical protein
MELVGERDRLAVPGADALEQSFGLLAKVFEVWVVRKISGRHHRPPLYEPAVRVVRRERR